MLKTSKTVFAELNLSQTTSFINDLQIFCNYVVLVNKFASYAICLLELKPTT